MDPINQNTGIQDAINQIKEWQTQGKKDDAIAGCKEVLEADPSNQEAKNILATLEAATAPAPAPTPAPSPTETHQIETPAPTEITTPSETTSEKRPSHGILLNLIAILLIAAIIGGGTFVYLKFNKPAQDKTTTEEEEQTEEKSQSEIRNDQRLADLQIIEEAIEQHFEENNSYPNVDEITTLLEMPYDPLDGQIDELGNIFAYSYAGYETEYILAGLFEEETGNTVLTVGANVNDHPDYRDKTSENVIFITNLELTAETEESEPKVKVKK